MSFSGSRARLVDAVFARLGEDARWGIMAFPVRVRWRSQDEDAPFDRAVEIVQANFIRVRRSEVAQPEVGDVIALLDEAGEPTGEEFTVIAAPKLSRNRVWVCEVERRFQCG